MIKRIDVGTLGIIITSTYRSSEQILKEALALPAEEKAKIAGRLLQSLDEANRREIDEAWGEEAERRIDAYERGETTSEDWEDVLKQVNQRKR
jgi:putative addiction module component (TIGR02574 family)